jgi:polygalacturonase
MSKTKGGDCGTFNVRDHGAIGDGKTLDTVAIQKAIDACAAKGGGRVWFDAGTFLSGAVELKSGVFLYLGVSAVLKASGNIDDYRSTEGIRHHSGLIHAQGVERIGIEGRGTVDCSGMAFMQTDRVHVLEDFEARYTRQGESYMAHEEEIVHGPYEYESRPGFFVNLSDCEDVRVRGVTFLDCPTWTFRVVRCRRVSFLDVVIDNDLGIPNSDGIHISACQQVRIADCDISAGDDAIALTTVTAHHGVPEGLPPERLILENVVVSNCTLRSRSGGVRIGYGRTDMRRIVLSNLVIHGSNRGIGIFSRDGGGIRDVLCSNIVIETDLVSGHWWGKGDPIQVSSAPGEGADPGVVENIRFQGVSTRSPAAAVLFAQAPGVVRDVSFENVSMRLTSSELQDTYGGNVDLRPTDDLSIGLFAHEMPALLAQNVQGLLVRDLRVEWANDLPDWFTRPVHCKQCSDVRVHGLRGAARPGHEPGVLFEDCQDAVSE